MKKLKTIELSSSGVNVSLYVWDSENKEDVKEMKETI